MSNPRKCRETERKASLIQAMTCGEIKRQACLIHRKKCGEIKRKACLIQAMTCGEIEIKNMPNPLDPLMSRKPDGYMS